MLATLTFVTSRSAAVPVSAEQGPTGGVDVRACNASSSANKPSKKPDKKKRGNSNNSPPEGATGCLEVHSSALDILEFLQAFVRDKRWNLSDEQNAEDAWTIVRLLDKEELLAYTKSDTSPSRVNWTAGKAFLQVSTLEVDGGFRRVQVSVTFLGYGQSLDPLAPPRKFWPLDSNRFLEAILISALETHFKSIG